MVLTVRHTMRFLITLWLGLITCTTYAQAPRFVLGKVLDAETGQGVDNASIINQRTRFVGRTNGTGTFYLQVKPGDSIIVNSPSHGRAAIQWDGVTKAPVISVKKQIEFTGVVLEEVTVRGKREADLKRELQQLLSEPVAKKGLTGEQVLDLAQSPITLLYELFSKRSKSDRKAAVVMQQFRKEQLADYRMELIIAKATNFKGDEAEQFKHFCHLTDDFVLQSSEYELTYAVLQTVDQFNRRKR